MRWPIRRRWRSSASISRADVDRGAARGRDRAAALGAAHLDLARSAHAACLDPRLRHQPRHLSATRSTTRRRTELDPHHPGGSRAAQPLHRQSARHDAARIRRDRAAHRPRRSRRHRRQRARARRARCSPRIASTVDLAADLPMLRLDPVLFEQVLFNLLDNAAKYAPPRHAQSGSRRGARTATVVARRCSTRATAFRPPISSASSTSSIASRPPTASAPAPASASPSAAASSRRWAAPSPPATAPTARARCSPSRCRSRPSDAPQPRDDVTAPRAAAHPGRR